MDSGGGGGEVTAAEAKRAKPSALGVDRLSALPDDILVKILLRLSTPDTVRTSELSKRWRRVWTLVPELRIPLLPEPPHKFRDALVAHQVPLRHLHVGVGDCDADPDSLAVWLPAAARRVSGSFALRRVDTNASAASAAQFELPCFEGATSIYIRGFLRLAVPPAGVFARLTDLTLERVRSSRELGDALSSQRCPRLQRLKLANTCGLGKFAIRSVSLLKAELKRLPGLLELTVEAPELTELRVLNCFLHAPSAPVATISASRLVLLKWEDMVAQEYVRFLGQMPHLRSVGNFSFLVYFEEGECAHNRACLEFLKAHRHIKTLTLTLVYLQVKDNWQYLMEAMKVLPDLTTLHLIVVSNGHAFGASSFHVLRKCTGIRKLVLHFAYLESKAPTACPSGCICEQQPSWQNEELLLALLEEIEILELGGSDHEVAFVERLFDWATALIKMSITFHISVTESKTKELCQMFQSFSRPGVCMDFRCINKKVLYAPED